MSVSVNCRKGQDGGLRCTADPGIPPRRRRRAVACPPHPRVEELHRLAPVSELLKFCCDRQVGVLRFTMTVVDAGQGIDAARWQDIGWRVLSLARNHSRRSGNGPTESTAFRSKSPLARLVRRQPM